tara:strand:- start:304 stop:2364 length:2061 start_codon:yes stop_codon:yes gene_type:complete
MPGRILPVRSNIRADRPTIRWQRRQDDSPGFMEVFGDIHTVLSSPLTAPIARGMKDVFGNDPEALRTKGSAGTPESALTQGKDVSGQAQDISGQAQDILSGDFGPKPGLSLTEPGMLSGAGAGFGLRGQATPPMSLNTEFPQGYSSFPESLSVGERAPLAPMQPGMQTPIRPEDYQGVYSQPPVDVDALTLEQSGRLMDAGILNDSGGLQAQRDIRDVIGQTPVLDQLTSYRPPEELLQQAAAQELGIPDPKPVPDIAPAPELPPTQPVPEGQQEPTPELMDKYKDMTAIQAARAALEEGAIMRADLDLTGIESWSPEQIAAAIPDANKSQVPFMTQWAERNTEPESLLDWISGASERKTRKLLASKKPSKGIAQSEIISLAAKIQDLRRKEGEDPLRREDMAAGTELTRARTENTREKTRKIKRYNDWKEKRYPLDASGNPNTGRVRRDANTILGLKSLDGATNEVKEMVRQAYVGLSLRRPSEFPPVNISNDSSILRSVQAALTPPTKVSKNARKSYALTEYKKLVSIREPRVKPTPTNESRWKKMPEGERESLIAYVERVQKRNPSAKTEGSATEVARMLANTGVKPSAWAAEFKPKKPPAQTKAQKDSAAARSRLERLEGGAKRAKELLKKGTLTTPEKQEILGVYPSTSKIDEAKSMLRGDLNQARSGGPGGPGFVLPSED